MRLKLDENLPHDAAEALSGLGHDASSVFAQRMSGMTDDRVWKKVQSEGRFFFTRDLDFADARKYPPGTHHGLLILRQGDLGSAALISRLRELATLAESDSWHGCVVVVTEARIRVRRPR